MIKRTLLTIAIVMISILANARGHRVLGRYIIGSSSYKEVMTMSGECEVNVYEDFYVKDHVQKVTAENYSFGRTRCKVVFLLVNDTLRSVQYYPTDPGYYSYMRHLNKSYNRTDSYMNGNSDVLWYDDSIQINKEMTAGFVEYFVHEDRKYMKKHPRYRNY